MALQSHTGLEAAELIAEQRPDERLETTRLDPYLRERLPGATGELGDCMDLEATHHIHTTLTEDHREAARAFAAKREPQFRGR